MTYSWTTPVVFADGAVYTASGLTAQITDNIGYLQQEYPRRLTQMVRGANASFTFSSVTSASQMYNTYEKQFSAPANGDYVTFQVVLAAGTYTVTVLGVKDADAGKMDWTMGATSIATGQDWYAAAPSYNAIFTINGVVVPESGRYVLTGVINGKHASSSSYYMKLTAVSFRQTAD